MSRPTPMPALGAALAVALVGALAPSANAASSPSPASPPSRLAAAQSDADSIKTQLGLPADQSLVARSQSVGSDGTLHARFDRTAGGLRVIGGDVVVSVKGGKVTQSRFGGSPIIAGSSGSSARTSQAKVTPGQAQAAAGGASTAVTPVAGTPELVLFHGEAPGSTLAYDVLVSGTKADQTPSRLHVVVDATSGAVLEASDEVVQGTGTGIFTGSVTLGTSGSSGSYTLQDSLGHVTTDLGNTTTGTGTLFTDADDVWGTGSNANRQSAGVDAHFGAEATFSYYKNTLGRNGIWNDGRGARSRVHYGNGYNNAFWDGTQMTYGDGTNNAKPLTEIDVAAHEMSHGVTENTAGLVYTGDAGGLNEATSDIFGTAVEWDANLAADTPDYLIGEKVDLRGNGTPLRYMDRPSRDGVSYDCWSTSVGKKDPHYSSGPLNHWFYLASEGSGAKTINGVNYNSPTCGGAPAVSGAGRAAIEKVWYRTLSTKLTSRSTYKNAREGAITSAIELYGAGSAECRAVESAFTAIAVPKGTAACTGALSSGSSARTRP